MLFNSVAFALFLGTVACLYHLCPLAWRRWCLLGASYAFYCTWSAPFALLLLAATGVAFVAANKVAAAQTDRQRKRTLTAGIVVLFLPLLVLKYCGALRPVLGELVGERWAPHLLWIGVAAPVGISYYTLKLVSYVVDVYWGRVQAAPRWSTVAAYGTFFPHILSGPIQRAGDFLAQVQPIRWTHPERIASGLRLILFGLFEKLVVADRLGVLVDQVYGRPAEHTGLAFTLAMYGFAVQLYADFSGLTDIAIGVGRVLGIMAPPNFDAPYYAENIQEFWRRWHMTLTGWLRDYLFTPLCVGLSDWGQAGLAVSLVVTMVAVGLWHAASLTYAVFGLVHGICLVVSSLTLRSRRRLYRRHAALHAMHGVLGPLVTFNMVVATLVIFRAENLGVAWYALQQSCGGLLQLVGSIGDPERVTALFVNLPVNWSLRDTVIACGAIVAMEIVHFLQHTRRLSTVLAVTPRWIQWAGYYALALCILIWAQTDSPQFIYAQF
jgi:hypothetical protein